MALALLFQGEDFAILPQVQPSPPYALVCQDRERIQVDISQSLLWQAKPADIRLSLWPPPPVESVCSALIQLLGESS